VHAIPYISKFNAEMQDKGLVVFGLNSVDNQPRNMDNLKRFISNRNISYDIIMTQPEVDKAYKIEGYPSMYVIGLDGKIAYVEIGYEAESFAKLKNEVKQLLNK
jgi:alanine racemase